MNSITQVQVFASSYRLYRFLSRVKENICKISTKIFTSLLFLILCRTWKNYRSNFPNLKYFRSWGFKHIARPSTVTPFYQTDSNQRQPRLDKLPIYVRAWEGSEPAAALTEVFKTAGDSSDTSVNNAHCLVLSHLPLLRNRPSERQNAE